MIIRNIPRAFTGDPKLVGAFIKGHQSDAAAGALKAAIGSTTYQELARRAEKPPVPPINHLHDPKAVQTFLDRLTPRKTPPLLELPMGDPPSVIQGPTDPAEKEEHLLAAAKKGTGSSVTIQVGFDQLLEVVKKDPKARKEALEWAKGELPPDNTPKLLDKMKKETEARINEINKKNEKVNKETGAKFKKALPLIERAQIAFQKGATLIKGALILLSGNIVSNAKRVQRPPQSVSKKKSITIPQAVEIACKELRPKADQFSWHGIKGLRRGRVAKRASEIMAKHNPPKDRPSETNIKNIMSVPARTGHKEVKKILRKYGVQLGNISSPKKRKPAQTSQETKKLMSDLDAFEKAIEEMKGTAGLTRYAVADRAYEIKYKGVPKKQRPPRKSFINILYSKTRKDHEAVLKRLDKAGIPNGKSPTKREAREKSSTATPPGDFEGRAKLRKSLGKR